MQLALDASIANLPAAERTASELDDMDALVRTYRPRLLRFVAFSLGDADLAESITQDCFLKAYNARDRFRGDCSISTWLTSIAVNLIRDQQRLQKFRFWRQARATAIDVTDAANFLPSNESSPNPACSSKKRPPRSTPPSKTSPPTSAPSSSCASPRSSISPRLPPSPTSPSTPSRPTSTALSSPCATRFSPPRPPPPKSPAPPRHLPNQEPGHAATAPAPPPTPLPLLPHPILPETPHELLSGPLPSRQPIGRLCHR